MRELTFEEIEIVGGAGYRFQFGVECMPDPFAWLWSGPDAADVYSWFDANGVAQGT